MYRYLARFILFLIICFFNYQNTIYGKNSEDNLLALEASVDASKIFEGQSTSLFVKIYSSTTDINYVNLAESIDLGENLQKLVAPVESTADGRWVKDTYKGIDCYSAIVFRSELLAVKSGNVTIAPIKFDVGLIRQAIVEDLFWGPIRKNVVENEQVSTQKLSFSISPLPKSKYGFSGAVGNFTLKSILPPGEIEADQELIVIYRLSGCGSLVSAVLPEIKKYLPEGLQFRSESHSENNLIRNGSFISNLDLEVTIYARNAGTYVIPAIEMVCFNPETGKYNTIKSQPVTIDVGKKSRSNRRSSQTFQI